MSSPVVLVVMGVSGSGKTTIAGAIAGRLGWELQEGDDLHPDANVDKMAHGTPLTDEDRWPWLDRVAAWIDDHLTAGTSGVITCSALKRSYRDVLRRDAVHFVYLDATRDELEKRLMRRQGHYMPASLLDSQLATLEPPSDDEQVFTVPIGQPAAEIAREIADRVSAP
ncbi:gluconokinase [Actinomycetes bacterium M1A6_2h]